MILPAHLLRRCGLLQRYRMIVALVDEVEDLLELRVGRHRKDKRIERKRTLKLEFVTFLSHSHPELVIHHITGFERRRCICVVQGEPRRQLYRDRVFFLPGVVKIDSELARAGWEHRSDSLLKKRRLKE